MNTIKTNYNLSTMSPGIVTLGQYGNGDYPIFKKPREFEGNGNEIRPNPKRRQQRGEGILSSAITALKKGAKGANVKSRFKKRIQTALRKKAQTAMTNKVQTAVKRLMGSKTLSKNVKNMINKKVKNLGPAAVRKIVAATPKENRVLGKISIKGPSHNDLVRQAERMIYSGANF